MASVVYNKFKESIGDGTIDLTDGSVYVALLMSNTTAGSQNDGIVYVDDITTLDECDGASYARQAIASPTHTVNDGNDRAEFDGTDSTFSTLGNGTRSIAGALLYVDADTDGAPADDATNQVIAYVEFASTVDPGGGNFTITWNAEGILQLA